jgi:hypothetical protein
LSTKCPICNTENPPDAVTCSQCGFGLSMAPSLWPDSVPMDVPEPRVAPPSSPAPTRSKDADAGVAGAENEAVKTPDRDALARAHIAKGFRAMREKSFDEARQEFERARDLAQDRALARMAKERLEELPRLKETRPPRLKGAARPELERAAPPGPKLQTEQAGPELEAEGTRPKLKAERPKEAKLSREEVPPRRLRRRPQVPPPPAIPAETLDWMAAARIGLLLGIANSVLTGCGAIFCVGCAFAPLFGFIAGWQVAGQRAERVPVSHALIAGAVASLIGWFGHVIGYLAWLDAISEPVTSELQSQSFTSELQCLTCFAGGVYIVLAMALSVLGWKIKTSRE